MLKSTLNTNIVALLKCEHPHLSEINQFNSTVMKSENTELTDIGNSFKNANLHLHIHVCSQLLHVYPMIFSCC